MICTICGKKLKAASMKAHMANVHDQKKEVASAPEVEAQDELFEAVSGDYTVFRPPFGGEIEKLDHNRRHDPTRDWDSVYHTYVKKSGHLDTRKERNAVRKSLGEIRRRGMW